MVQNEAVLCPVGTICKCLQMWCHDSEWMLCVSVVYGVRGTVPVGSAAGSEASTQWLCLL